MEIISTVFYFIVAIFILVTVHEFGHFAAAKLFGMRVHKFFIGFDFWNLKLWSIQRGETEYGIGAIPLGGYVQIAGMVDESLDTDFANKPAQPWEFRAKPLWQRLIVISAGVIMNMVLAVVILVGVAVFYGDPKTPITAEGIHVPENSVFAEMGMKTGDNLIEVNGQSVKYWEEALDPEIFVSSPLTFTVERDGNKIKLDAPSNTLSRINDAKGDMIRPLSMPFVEKAIAGQPAEKIGLRPGDLITSVAGVEVKDTQDMIKVVGQNANKEIALTWKQGAGKLPEKLDGAAALTGETKSAQVTPTAEGRIGVGLASLNAPREYVSLGFFEAIASGFNRTVKMTSLTVKGFAKMFTGEVDVRQNLGGPIKIAKMAGKSAEQGAGAFAFFLAVLSISLAFLNILPVPALDGGQFVMNVVESAMGKELPLKVKVGIQQAGMFALLALMAFIFYNDIAHP
jgi:regulator of sigma E protease